MSSLSLKAAAQRANVHVTDPDLWEQFLSDLDCERVWWLMLWQTTKTSPWPTSSSVQPWRPFMKRCGCTCSCEQTATAQIAPATPLVSMQYKHATSGDVCFISICPVKSWSPEKTLPPDLAGMARMKRHKRWAGMLLEKAWPQQCRQWEGLEMWRGSPF